LRPGKAATSAGGQALNIGILNNELGAERAILLLANFGVLMATIDHFNLRSFDLNLFLAFDAIMTERNVTRAAKRLRVRQPAMSHSLSTLRMLFQDELFIRRGQTMEPTPYAVHLAGPVRRLLAQAQDTLTTRAKFDELSQQRTFRMAFSAGSAALILPNLYANIRAVAPGARLAVLDANQESIPDILQDGRSEIGVGYFETRHAWVRQEALFQERYVCCFNNNLLKIDPRISLKDYFDFPHVTVSTKNSQLGCLERAFAGLGKRPNVTMSVSHFFPAATIAARTPVLTTLPAILATRYAVPLGLTLSPLPFDVDTCPVSMVWHSRLDGDESAEWLRKSIKETVKQLGAEVQLPDFLQGTGTDVIRIKERRL
jgi:DNA-binding transcriptional LysR family regulator